MIPTTAHITTLCQCAATMRSRKKPTDALDVPVASSENVCATIRQNVVSARAASSRSARPYPRVQATVAMAL